MKPNRGIAEVSQKASDCMGTNNEFDLATQIAFAERRRNQLMEKIFGRPVDPETGIILFKIT